jgi:hypothetical protein
MILESLLILLLLFGALLVVYKGAVHEYQILQKDWSPNIEWSSLLGEQLPIVIRNVSQEWRGSWTRKATEAKSWPVYVETDEDIRKTTWKQWIHSPPGEPLITNRKEIAAIAKLPTQQWLDGGFRRWSWLPRSNNQIFVVTSDVPLPLTKTTAAATVVQITDGPPVTVWLAHEGAIPGEVQQDLNHQNPWTLSGNEIPLFEEIKYIEVKLRPGNALVVPTHWWYAVQGPSVGQKAEGTWGWIASFHTPVSWIVNKILEK